MDSGDDVKERRFARAIWTDESGNTSPFDRERGVLDSVNAAKVFVDVLNFQQSR